MRPYLPPLMRFLVPITWAVCAMLVAGCAGGLSSSVGDGYARTKNHPGATLKTDFAGNSEMTAATPTPIPQVDFDTSSMAARGVQGDGLRLGPDGALAFNSLSNVSFKDAVVEFFEEGGIKSIALGEYGGDRDALFASLSAQTQLAIEGAMSLSADQREKYFKLMETGGVIAKEAIAAARAYFSAGLSEVVPPPPDDEPDS